jgi:translation initiation factor IF-3
MIVIDDEGNNHGELSRSDALDLAKEKGLDLVIVSRNKDSIVTKITDIAKYKYEKSKKLKKNKGKSAQHKEVWFKPNIQDRDMFIKLDKTKEFIKKGGTVKLTLRSDRKNRLPLNEMYNVMNKIIETVSEFAKPINTINREGRNLSITVKSIK